MHVGVGLLGVGIKYGARLGAWGVSARDLFCRSPIRSGTDSSASAVSPVSCLKSTLFSEICLAIAVLYTALASQVVFATMIASNIHFAQCADLMRAKYHSHDILASLEHSSIAILGTLF